MQIHSFNYLTGFIVMNIYIYIYIYIEYTVRYKNTRVDISIIIFHDVCKKNILN